MGFTGPMWGKRDKYAWAAAVAAIGLVPHALAEKPLAGGHWKMLDIGQTPNGGTVAIFFRDDGIYTSSDGLKNVWSTMLPDEKGRDQFRMPDGAIAIRYLYRVDCKDRRHQMADVRMLDPDSVVLQREGDLSWLVSNPDDLFYKAGAQLCGRGK